MLFRSVTLYLTVKSAIGKVDSVAICESAIPYLWHNESYISNGLYYDTIQSSLGCDSILTLDLTILPEYAVIDSQSIKTSEMPYNYMDTIFNDKSISGKSTHILTRSS